jgi:hypothetical protein
MFNSSVIVFALNFHFYLYISICVVFLGQQARDALLLIMQLSNRNEYIAKYIAENTNFCPVRLSNYFS